ncbi:MAG: hypothetical protein WCP55_20420, partial [Lentisphaerota bacterium]
MKKTEIIHKRNLNKSRLLFSGRCIVTWFSAAILMFLASLASAETWIVKDGKAQAEIIVSPKPTRTAKLAASELQRFIERISGAKLPL